MPESMYLYVSTLE